MGSATTPNVTFRLREPATVTMDVTRTVKVPHTIYTLTSTLAAGVHTLSWAPAPTTNPRTFLVRISAVDRAGNRVVYGAANAFVGRAPKGVVVRVQGIDAGFGQPSYAPGQVARIRIATDAPALSMRIFHSGPEQVVTYADNQMAGVDIGTPPTAIDWSQHRSEPGSISFRIPNVPERALLRPVRRRGRPRRLRAVRRPPGGARGDRPRARRSCRRTPGRPTTSRTPTATATATRGTPGRRTASSTSRARTSRAASRRASTATTCRSCTGCSGQARAPSSSPTPTSTRSRTATTSRARTTSSSSRGTRST